ncbi:MICAL C-terminal-like protein [Ctenocephalides felis]|uniref:MICAL C-terminal-like protein n=1 Tax=Ctenocephalides felis TaxID=7515 RepID=UPI000E6E4D7D|nr:MICAL C-terminal-like protein [Ctenocephalides felis]
MNRPSSTSTVYSNYSQDSAKDKSIESPRKEVKTKDRERRKSIIQAVSDFFHKRISHSNPTSPIKDGKAQGIYSSQKSKDKSKSCFDMDHLNSFENYNTENVLPYRCQSEKNLIVSRTVQDEQPPPIPPPPLNYAPPDLHHVSDGSQSEDLDGRGISLETLDYTNSSYNLDGTNPSSTEPKRRRSQRAIRKAELKRFRRAQENQRQREETEVKQRELEAKGVAIEKALRGEGTENTQLDEQLFASWMQLRREQQKLHVYDQMLSIQARELQLEDRHARLQNELRERLSQDDSTKTTEDANRESQILQEMLEIVKMHDSLVLERDRLRSTDTPTSNVQEAPIDETR